MIPSAPTPYFTAVYATRPPQPQHSTAGPRTATRAPVRRRAQASTAFDRPRRRPRSPHEPTPQASGTARVQRVAGAMRQWFAGQQVPPSAVRICYAHCGVVQCRVVQFRIVVRWSWKDAGWGPQDRPADHDNRIATPAATEGRENSSSQKMHALGVPMQRGMMPTGLRRGYGQPSRRGAHQPDSENAAINYCHSIAYCVRKPAIRRGTSAGLRPGRRFLEARERVVGWVRYTRRRMRRDGCVVFITSAARTRRPPPVSIHTSAARDTSSGAPCGVLMPDVPDKTPAKKSDETDDRWPHTMRHYKWEKKEPEPAEPAPDGDATPSTPRRARTADAG